MSPSRPEIITDLISQGRPGHVQDAHYFYFETHPASRAPLEVICGGIEQCAADFEVNRGNYPYFFITYVLRGQGRLESVDRAWTLRAGDLTGFGPGQAHLYRAEPDDPMQHVFVTFVGLDAPRLLDQSKLAAGHVVNTSEPEEASSLLDTLLNEGMRKTLHAQELCGYYLRILLLRHGAQAATGPEHHSRALQTYLECRKFIDVHFSELTGPGEVATACGVNVRYLANLFKRFGSTTPQDYLTRLKMNRAANLLLTSNLQVQEIAAMVGFQNPYHFSHSFKKVFGVAPQPYRQRHV